jgi:hypothetical protein
MNETVIAGAGGERGCLARACFSSAAFGGRCARAFRRNGRRLVSRQPAAADEHCPGWLLLVSGGHWERLLACLLGFVIARLIVTRLTGPADRTINPAKEASHAP